MKNWKLKKIKNSIKGQTILYFPSESELTYLHIDASDFFWACVLIAQKKEIVAYTSGKFSKTQQKYSIYDKEF